MAKVKSKNTNNTETKKSTNNRKTWLLILLVVLGLSIGYAALTTTLRIIGDVTILHREPQGIFDVHWENLNVLTGSNLQVDEASISADRMEVDYNIKFDTPGQVFEFTVDAVNSGNYNAISEASTDTVLTDAQKRYLTYTVLEEGATPTAGKSLPKGSSVTYKVRVEFKLDITNDDLNAAKNTELDLRFLVPYVQS